MRTLRTDLSNFGLENLKRQLEAYKAELTDAARTIAGETATVGADVVQAELLATPYAGDKGTVSASVETTDRGARINVVGDKIGFLEFGTGIKYPLGAYADQVGALPHGSYGAHNGLKKAWIYKGERGETGIPVNGRKEGLYWSDGNRPANAFPKAVERMKEESGNIAKEVLGP